MTSETDNKVEAAVERMRALAACYDRIGEDARAKDLRALLSDRDRLAAENETMAEGTMAAAGLLSDEIARRRTQEDRADEAEAQRDRLAAEVERWKRQSDDWQKRGWELGNSLDTAEAKLSALVEVLVEALSFINEAAGACLGLAMSGNNHPDADGVQMDLSRRAMTLAQAIRQVIASLDRTAPESAEPAQEVAGLVEGDEFDAYAGDDLFMSLDAAKQLQQECNRYPGRHEKDFRRAILTALAAFTTKDG